MTQCAHPIDPRRVVPGVAGERMLRLVATYHYLTAQQICRALYAPGSLTRVQAILKRLREAGYVQAIFLPRRTQAGSAPSVYTVSRKGRLYLHHLGVPISVRVRPSEERAHSGLFLEHTLAVNDVLLAATQLAQANPHIELAGVQHERELKRGRVTVPTSTGKPIRVVPDAWLDFRFQGWQFAIIVELDRGTEDKKAWMRKVQHLAAYVDGPYQAAFSTDSRTVAVFAVSGQKRVTQLRRWTKEALAATHHQDLAGYFVFAHLLPAVVSPHRLFLERVWQTPSTDALHALIESEG